MNFTINSGQENSNERNQLRKLEQNLTFALQSYHRKSGYQSNLRQ